LSEAITRNAFFTVPGTAGRERRAKVALAANFVNSRPVVNGKNRASSHPSLGCWMKKLQPARPKSRHRDAREKQLGSSSEVDGFRVRPRNRLFIN
jgi:hypothetical protein